MVYYGAWIWCMVFLENPWILWFRFLWGSAAVEAVQVDRSCGTFEELECEMISGLKSWDPAGSLSKTWRITRIPWFVIIFSIALEKLKWSLLNFGQSHLSLGVFSHETESYYALWHISDISP